MKSKFLVIVFLCLSTSVSAQIRQQWDFTMLTEQSSLIVIATPTKVTATTEHTALPNIETKHSDGTTEKVMADGMEATFDVLTVLKGSSDTKELTLHYYAVAAEKWKARGAPGLVVFEPNDKEHFLMFLTKESDGRYAATNGQTDPNVSIQLFVGQYP